MKFNDIPIGQRFELEGAIYVKSSPMLASPEAGGASRFVARYMQVQPLDVTSASPRKMAEQQLRMGDVLAAFDVFYEFCRNELAPAGEMQEKLRAERETFVATLEQRARKP